MATTATTVKSPGRAARGEKGTPPADPMAGARRAAGLLKLVADPTRLQVLLAVADEPVNVGTLVRRLGISQPALSHHIAIQRHAGLIYPVRQGKENHYHASDAGKALAAAVRPLAGG